MLIPQAGPDIPGSGAMIHAIEGVTDRLVEVICGKPSSHARELALEALGVDAADCLVVGDRLDTDIALGDAGGMTTALVLTGVTDRETLAAAPIQPDHVLDSLAELSTLL